MQRNVRRTIPVRTVAMQGLVMGLALSVWLLPAAADIYKCEGPSGVSYSDKPCGSKTAVVKQAPAEPARQNSSRGDELMRKCRAGDQKACFAPDPMHHNSVVGAERIEPAQPAGLLRQFESSCTGGQRAKFFALHSKKIEKRLSAESEARQGEIFRMYCGMVRELMAKMPGGDPAAAAYMRKEVPVGSKGRRKSVLCIMPAPSEQPSCKFQFDVVIEDGVMKKDEL
jgi:hypothetical protein